MISHKYKFYFQHIPKCAGTSIANHFEQLHIRTNSIDQLIFNGHEPYRDAVKGFDYKNYYIFTFVRNPWDRVVSLFHYRKWMVTDGYHPAHWPPAEEILNDNFKTFIHKDSLNTNESIHYLEEPCFHHTWLANDIISKFNYIGKVETAQEDFKNICNDLKINDHDLPHVNKSNHKRYIEYYDEETKQIVAEKYAKDIELFGYKFGE